MNVLGPVGSAGITVTEDDVVQPRRDDAVGVHQISDRLKHSFEVVLLLSPSHQNVERVVHVLTAVVQRLVVDPVLVAVEPDAVSDLVPGQHGLVLGRVVIDQLSLVIDQTFDLAAPDIRQPNLRHKPLRVAVSCP